MVDDDPDYRFTLANERTFLAWIRTALALLAGGVAIGQLFAAGVDEAGHKILGAFCVVAAATIAIGAFRRWRQIQTAMRLDASLPDSTMMGLTVCGVCMVAAFCAALIVV
jgi:putative membrane protein